MDFHNWAIRPRQLKWSRLLLNRGRFSSLWLSSPAESRPSYGSSGQQGMQRGISDFRCKNEMETDEIRDRDSLLAVVRGGIEPEYLFFWGHKPLPGGEIGKSCLSQWWPATFTLEGERYPTSEHFMMAEKARLFEDEATRARILLASSPGAAKRLGREVRGFEQSRWEAARFEIVVRGNRAKFEQHLMLRDFLLSTGGRVLVEASPMDRIWGIGLAADDPRVENPGLWRGLNLLGFALMEVRRLLSQTSE